MTFLIRILILGSLLIGEAHPFEIESIDPSTLAPGKENSITFAGNNFIGTERLWTSFSAEAKPIKATEASSTHLQFQVPVPTTEQPEVVGLRLVSEHDISPFHFLLIDPLPVIRDEAARSPHDAQTIDSSTAIRGTTESLAFKYYALPLESGQTLSAEVFAQRIGSGLDAVLTLRDPNQREVASNDDRPASGADPGFTYQAEKAGVHYLELHDIEYREEELFHLRIGNFPLTKASFPKESEPKPPKPDVIKLPATALGCFLEDGASHDYFFEGEKSRWISITPLTRSLGSPAFTLLKLFDPDGKRLAQSGTGDEEEERLTEQLPATGRYRLTVEELTGASGPYHHYQVIIDNQVGPFQFQFLLHDDGDDEEDILSDTLLATPGSRIPLQVLLSGPKDADTVQLQASIDGTPCETFPSSLKPSDAPQEIRVKFPVKSTPGTLARLEISATSEIDGFPYTTPLDFQALTEKTLPNQRQTPSWLSTAAHHIGFIRAPFTVNPEHTEFTLTQGESKSLHLLLDWDFPNKGAPIEKITIALENRPKGVSAKPLDISHHQKEALLEFSAADDADFPSSHKATIQPSFEIRGQLILLPSISLHFTE